MTTIRQRLLRTIGETLQLEMKQCHTGGRAVVSIVIDFALMQRFYKLYLGPVESNLKKKNHLFMYSFIFFASN